jgi:heme A synthase
LFVTNVDSIEGPRVAVTGDMYVIGSNVDTRLSLTNDLVLTSAISSWDEMYKRILNTAFNSSLHSFTEFDGYEENAVTLTAFSPFVTNNIRELVNAELKILVDEGPKNRIFIGPVDDNKGIRQICDGCQLSMAEIYAMDWTISNVTNLDWKLIYPAHDDNRLSEAVVNFFYFLLAFFYAAVCALALWVYLKREHPVIKFAQPVFIYFLLLGILVGISTILPLTYQIPVTPEQAYTLGADDIDTLSDPWVDEACQSLGWLLITGYGLTMPVLILKTYRLHRIILGAKLGGFRKKAAVGTKETNLIVLFYLVFSYFFLGLWQVIDPMHYRIEVLEYDKFNNPIESYGYCSISRKPAVTACLTILVTFVVLVVLVGNFICFIARNDETVNNEVTYIALSMVNFLQIVLVAGPVMVVLVEKPTPRFLVSAAAVILSFGGLMALIFGPKIIAIAFFDEKSAQFTIRKEGNGIVAGLRKQVYGGGSIQAPPRADDPNSNPASNLAQWRRNSRLATSSNGMELSEGTSKSGQSVANPIVTDSPETNDQG